MEEGSGQTAKDRRARHAEMTHTFDSGPVITGRWFDVEKIGDQGVLSFFGC